MLNIPANTETINLEIPKENVKSSRETIELPELPEYRNPILDDLGKSHSDFSWTDEFNMRGAYTFTTHTYSTEQTVIDWIKELEATAAKGRKLKYAGFDVTNMDEVTRTLNDAYKKLNKVQVEEAKRKRLEKARDARNESRIRTLIEAERGGNSRGLYIDNTLVLVSDDPEYPFLVRRGDDFVGFNPSEDQFESLPESVQLALMPALVFMDELHLTPENTMAYRQWFIDKF